MGAYTRLGALALGGLALSLAAAPTSAQAAIVEEAHVGVLRHNIRIVNPKNADKEDGPDVQVEVALKSPKLLRYVFSPNPYVVASVNVAGETSFGGVGLTWRWRFAENWSLEPGLGYIVHNGELDTPFAKGTTEAQEFGEENLLLGSRDLFRTSIGLSRKVTERVSVQAFYEHMSHGQIIGSGRNQGLDNAGLRVGYRFGD